MELSTLGSWVKEYEYKQPPWQVLNKETFLIISFFYFFQFFCKQEIVGMTKVCGENGGRFSSTMFFAQWLTSKI
jgi:hypothetical protein